MTQNGKANILLVEDEEHLHEALKMNLEMEGYEITSAFTGTEALKAIGNEYFDLIVLDIMLPEVDGISITETVRVNNNEVPILILSARNSGADRVLGLKKGADDYLTKRIMEKHHGKIMVTDNRPTGSIFTATFSIS